MKRSMEGECITESRSHEHRRNPEFPSVITLGMHPGYVIYFVQHIVCNKCEETSHLALHCLQTTCFNYEEKGHVTGKCQGKRNFNLCGKERHVFWTCPKSFSSKKRLPRRGIKERKKSQKRWHGHPRGRKREMALRLT